MPNSWMRLFLLLCLGALALAGRAADKPNLKEQMRLLWPSTTGSLTRSWLVCGEFPLVRADEAFDAGALAAGFANDYLQGHGGEAAIRPLAGWEHLRPDGTTAAWKKFDTKNNNVDFWSALRDRPGDGAVWYAFTPLAREQAGKAVIILRSSNTVKVWLNGELIHQHVQEFETDYTDSFEVTLHAGENAVLVKVVQQVSGGFTLRVTDPASAQAQESITPRLSPYLTPEQFRPPDTLVVATDDGRRSLLNTVPVEVTVTAPGGTVLGTKTVARGEQVIFPTTGWVDGPYEIRVSADGSTGEHTNTYLLWYKGDALAAAKALVKTAPTVDGHTPGGAMHAMLAELITNRLGKDWAKVRPAQLPAVYAALLEFAELQEFGVEHQPGRLGGLVRLVYRDDTDDSPQFCRVYLPPNYSPRKSYPVIINLHGRADTFPSYANWGGVDQRHDRLSEAYQAITVYPHARGNTWYRGMGDRDVMRCLAMVKERFSVDDDRVYLIGYSMGGAGVWYVGSRHPEQFAALAPFFGGYDFRFQLDTDALGKLTPREQYRRERLSYIGQVEALRTTPVFASHGDTDNTVPVDYSRYTVRLLQRWGYDVRYWETPGAGHGGLGNDQAVLDWLLMQKRAVNPDHVTVRSCELRFAAAHWVKILQRKNPYAFMQADADVLAPNVIKLTTDNVLEIALSPTPPLVDPGQPVQVIWNGGEPLSVPMRDGKLVLRTRGYEPKGLVKRPELEGPVTDLYNTPFALVVGSISPDPLMRRMCARAAERYAAWWDERFHVQPRVFLDTAISPEDQAKYSLLLFGGPNDNAVAKAMADDLPLALARNLVTLGGHEFAVRDAAVQLLYPNPRNADRYVVVRAATSPQAMALTDYVLNDVDFCIIDGNNADATKAGDFFDAVTGRCSGTPILAGYFDNVWQFQDTYLEQDTAPRNAPRQTAPRYADTSPAVTSLPLADTAEMKAEGLFLDLSRNACRLVTGRGRHGKDIMLVKGLSVPPVYWLPRMNHAIEYTLTDGQWTHLRATLGLEVDASPEAAEKAKQSPVRIEFVVKGDGVVLYHSPTFGYDTPPCNIDVDVTGVETLRLEILNLGPVNAPVEAVDWGNVRLER